MIPVAPLSIQGPPQLANHQPLNFISLNLSSLARADNGLGDNNELYTAISILSSL